MELHTVLVAHFAATCVMTGLIWFVQVVHYPLFASVGREAFAAYQAQHVRLTTYVVGPPMLIEATTGVYLVSQAAALPNQWAFWAGMVLLGVVWVATAAFSVPAHGRLEAGFDAKVHARLVWTNWVRTLAWTARVGLVWLLL
ncbi:MAG: hypothetical protein R3E66_13165 [bacterium]